MVRLDPRASQFFLLLDRRLIMLPKASVTKVVWSPYACSFHFGRCDDQGLSHKRPIVRFPFQVDHKTVRIPSGFSCVLLESTALVLEYNS